MTAEGILLPLLGLVIGLITGAVGATAYAHRVFATKSELASIEATFRERTGYIISKLDNFIERFVRYGQ